MNWLRNTSAMRAFFTIIIAIVLAAVWSPSALAQQTTGAITGTVSDSSGAVMAGVEVRLTNVGTGIAQTQTSDAGGNFRFLLLPSGTYRVEANMAGFKSFTREGIIVQVGRSVNVPVAMNVGQVTEKVVVTAGADLLEPNTSSLGTVMEGGKIEELPISGRNPMALANLMPTVRGVGGFGGYSRSTWGVSSVSIAGGQPLSVGYLVDGIANDKMIDSGGITVLTVEGTQEFKVQTNGMSAEFGRTAGGVISVISKSGTNQFHGSLFEFFRNDKLNATEFFANKAGGKRPVLRFNQFGGAIGGPIKKDKLFFFVNYEGFREIQSPSRTISSPTALERSGDFSQTFTSTGQLITIYDPVSTRPDPNRAGSYLRTAFAGNKIPAERLNPVGQKFLSFYPMPNLPGLPFTHAQNLFQQGTRPMNKAHYNFKLDYNLTSTRRISGRYTPEFCPYTIANYFHNKADPDGRTVWEKRHAAVVEYTDTLGPTLLLSARMGFNRENEFYTTPWTGFKAVDVGWPSILDSQVQGRSGFPAISVSDVGNWGRPDALGNPSTTGSVGAALTKIRGPLTMKWGFEHRLYRRNDWGPSSAYGSLSFTRGFTQGPDPLTASTAGGYGLASLLLGYPSSDSAGYNTDQTRSFNVDALYMQNDWKVTRKLTLNIGLRWEYEGPVKDRYNVASNFDPSMPSPLQVPGMTLKGGLIFPGVKGVPRGLTTQDFKNFDPRFGFAYQAMRKIVVRGGFGIIHDPTTGVGYTTTGFSTSTAMVTSIDGGLTPFGTLSNPFPDGILKPTGSSLGGMTGLGTGIGGQLRDTGARGYIEQWNTTVQFEPKPGWLIEAAWVGNHGVRNLFYTSSLNYISDANLALGSQLVQSVNNPFYGYITTGTMAQRTVTRRQLLLPYPQFTSVSGGYKWLGNSIYHAAAFKVEKRFSRGFSILAAYTISKAIDDGEARGQIRPGADTSTTVQNWNNMAAERSISIWDVPQRLVLTGMWDLPFGKSGPPALRFVIGGWQANAIATMESGSPISLAATITGGGNRPNVVAGVSDKVQHPTLETWFNRAAFSQPASYTYGNVSRTLPDVRGPGQCTVDASLFKNFKITESKRIEFRTEAFNLMNTPTFDVPGRTLGSATFGVVTSTRSDNVSHPRYVQFAMRFIF